jgi:hypothetical protein
MKSDGMHIVSEWEDNIVFDSDDPDFCNGPPQQPIRQTTTLTTSLQLRQFILKGRLITLNFSISAFVCISYFGNSMY